MTRPLNAKERSAPRGSGRRGRPWAAAAVVSAMLAVARLPHAWADGPIDHQRARQAMLAGEIRPLSDILQAVQPQLRGELMAIELEQEEGRWLYEFKVLEPGGRIVEWYVDARSAQVIKREVKAHKGRR